MTKYTILIFSFILSLGYAQIPQGYYDAAEGLTGYPLKTVLKTIIDDIDDGNGIPVHNPQVYADLDLAYANAGSGFIDNYSFYDNDGFLLDIYSENPNGSDPYNFEMITDECGNYNDEGVCYNKEHLLPQSFFNQQEPMRGDIHYVFPTDGQVNGYRASFPFGEVDSPNLTTQNGSKRGQNIFPGYNGTVFEPLDIFKGDIARALFYFATRYEDQVNTSGWDNPQDNILHPNKNQFFDDWYIDMLLEWHINDPVSLEEMDRNNNGFIYQNNRNPFIDNPTYVQAIWDENFSIISQKKLSVLAYPNPVFNSFFSLSVEESIIDKIEIYDVLGDLVYNRKVANSSRVINVGGWSKGVYFVKVFGNKTSQVLKVILN